MKRKIISATLGTILCLVVTLPVAAQDEGGSAGLVQAIYAAIASWLGDAGAAVGETAKSPQTVYDPALLLPSNVLESGPGDGPEMTPIIVPTG